LYGSTLVPLEPKSWEDGAGHSSWALVVDDNQEL
jgi:hypothetical protein